MASTFTTGLYAAKLWGKSYLQCQSCLAGFLVYLYVVFQSLGDDLVGSDDDDIRVSKAPATGNVFF